MKYDSMVDDGDAPQAIADRLEVPLMCLKAWKRNEDEYFSVPGPWQLPYNGKTWQDMPGSDTLIKRCNFALFRRGLLDLEASFMKKGGFTSAIFKRGRGRPSKTAFAARKANLDKAGSLDADFDAVALREEGWGT